MNRREAWKHFRLTLIFSAMVSLILIATIFMSYAWIQMLYRLNLINLDHGGFFPIVMFSIISLIIGSVMAVIVSHSTLKPLREIMNATDKIASGDYSVRLDLKGLSEFQDMSNKFNHMAEELDSVEMLRADFVNNFSHEFKTPIVSIRGFAKALKWDDLSKVERDEYLDIIINESERLSALSSNVLYLSKLEKQTILTDKRKFNVSEQIRLVIALLDQKFTEKRIDILFDTDEFFVEGNEEMLRQVWINLLDNAIKFSPVGGQIEVRIKEAFDAISIKISDEGKGIAPRAKARIFDKFYQEDASHSTAGNGLGLTIVKKIVNLHEGEIIIRSSDKGSTFEIKLRKIKRDA